MEIIDFFLNQIISARKALLFSEIVYHMYIRYILIEKEVFLNLLCLSLFFFMISISLLLCVRHGINFHLSSAEQATKIFFSHTNKLSK